MHPHDRHNELIGSVIARALMVDLTADDWYQLTGRGPVATFAAGKLPAHVQNPKQLINTTILVDGKPYQVKGVEHWAIVCDGECGHPFGLLLKE